MRGRIWPGQPGRRSTDWTGVIGSIGGAEVSRSMIGKPKDASAGIAEDDVRWSANGAGELYRGVEEVIWAAVTKGGTAEQGGEWCKWRRAGRIKEPLNCARSGLPWKFAVTQVPGYALGGCFLLLGAAGLLTGCFGHKYYFKNLGSIQKVTCDPKTEPAETEKNS